MKANALDLTNHLNDTVDAHDASAISFTPHNFLTDTDVQNAIETLEDSKYPKFDGEPNGFEDRTQTTITYDEGTRTFTITPTGASYTIWSNGTKYVKTGSISLQHDATEGNKHYYFDSSGTLTVSNTFGSDVILRYCYIAGLYWDATNSKLIGGVLNEQHGCEMPAEVHKYLHETNGTKFVSGLSLTLNATGDGSSEDHIRFAGASGRIDDEDIPHSVLSRLVSDNIIVLYRSGATGLWREKSPIDSYPIIMGASRPQYNQYTGATWQLTEVTNGNFMLIHIYAVPGIDVNSAKYVIVTGQGQYSTAANARTNAAKEANNLKVDGFPFAECKLIGTAIIECNDSLTNTKNARFIQSLDDYGDLKDYLDWRYVDYAPGSASSSTLVAGGNNGEFQYNNGGTLAGSTALTTTTVTDLTDGGDSTLHYHASDRALGNATGTLAIANGGTGQTTAQLAINALTNVAGATNEYVLTKDTATGNAIFKASAGGGGGYWTRGTGVLYPTTLTDKVGIGTSTPYSKIEIRETSSDTARGITLTQSSSDNNSAIMLFRKDKGSPTSSVSNGDVIGSFYFAGNDGSTYQYSSFFGGTTDGTVSSGSVPIALRFGTGTASFSTERLRITSSGLFAFGDAFTSPTARVHIKGVGNTSATYAQKIENSSGTSLLSVRDDGRTELYNASYPTLVVKSASSVGIELFNTGISTPFTTLYPSGTVGAIAQYYSANGGFAFQGFSNNATKQAFALQGHVGSANPTAPAITLEGWKSAGTDRTAMTGTEIVLQVLAGQL